MGNEKIAKSKGWVCVCAWERERERMSYFKDKFGKKIKNEINSGENFH